MNLQAENPLLHKCFEQAKAYPPDDFGPRWKKIDVKEADQFKLETSYNLPKDYLEFILEFGEFAIWTDGFEKLYARATWPSGKSANVEIGTISGPAGMLQYQKSYMTADKGPRIPPNLVPLTFDGAYGHAMMDLSPENLGKIRYLNVKAKAFGTDGYGFDQVGTIADNFTAFVSQIGTAQLRNKALGTTKRS